MSIKIKRYLQLTNKFLVLMLLATIIVKVIPNRKPSESEIVNQLSYEPVQKAVEKNELNIMKKDTVYKVKPVYSYELYGLVVSQHDSSSFADYYHKRWGDHLNTKDICVVWGDNVKDDIFHNVSFKSGSFTCYYKYGSKVKNFNPNQLSNNHLLTDDKSVEKLINSTQIGDQIKIQGYLVNYGTDSTDQRTSSVTRTDNGCEVILVTGYEFLKMNAHYKNYINFVILAEIVIIIFFNIFRHLADKKSSIIQTVD